MSRVLIFSFIIWDLIKTKGPNIKKNCNKCINQFSLSFNSNFEKATTMNFYTPQDNYSEGNSVCKNSVPDNCSPMIYAMPNTISTSYEIAPLANAAKPETSLPANMNYDDFKSAVVALGLRNRPYDLSWENNANQLHSNMQQAEHQMIDTTCTSILYNCLFNQREEINFIKAALYSVMTAMLEQKEKDTKQKEKEMKKIQRAQVAAQKKSLLIPPPYPPPRPPTPPPKPVNSKGKKRPNIERLVESYSQTNLVPDYIQPVLQKKSKKK